MQIHSVMCYKDIKHFYFLINVPLDVLHLSQVEKKIKHYTINKHGLISHQGSYSY